MSKSISVLTAAVAFLAAYSVQPAAAQGRCPAGDTGCTPSTAGNHIQKRVNDGARRVIRNENPSGRVREVGGIKYKLRLQDPYANNAAYLVTLSVHAASSAELGND
jgi:hypothetical protein